MIIKTNTLAIYSPTIPTIKRTGDSLFSASDLVYFSSSRWEMLSQRSRRKLSNHAQKGRVFFIEEPVVEFIDSWWIDINQNERGVWVAVPHVLDWVSDELREAMCQSLVNELFEQFAIATSALWYSTPSAPPLTHHSKLAAVAYNGMNELSTAQSMLP